MSATYQPLRAKSCALHGGSSIAAALALVGMLFPLAGWNAPSQWHNSLVAEHPDERQTECPGEDQDDSADGELELHFLVRRPLRETMPPQAAGWGAAAVTLGRDAFAALICAERPAAEFNAAPLPLRC